MSTISRRHTLFGAATAGMGLPILAACGGDEAGSSASDPAAPSSSASSSSASSSPASPSSTATTSAGAPSGIATSEVPVGGGLVVPDEQVVITQPTAGDFKAFTAICTHQGCVVARVGEEIECDCHLSRFSITDGRPTSGPAAAPLAPADITVSGNTITVG